MIKQLSPQDQWLEEYQDKKLFRIISTSLEALLGVCGQITENDKVIRDYGSGESLREVYHDGEQYYYIVDNDNNDIHFSFGGIHGAITDEPTCLMTLTVDRYSPRDTDKWHYGIELQIESDEVESRILYWYLITLYELKDITWLCVLARLEYCKVIFNWKNHKILKNMGIRPPEVFNESLDYLDELTF